MWYWRTWLAALSALCVVYGDVASAGALPGQINLSSAPEALHVYGAVHSGQGDQLSAKAAGSSGIMSTPTIAYGDINGDGYQDVIIGAPYHYAPTAGAEAGGVYVIYGSAVSTGQIALNSFGGLVIQGETSGGQLGAAVAAADVNGDGYDDIIVGAPNNIDASTQVPLGSVYVIYGGPSLPAEIDLAKLSSLAAGTVSVFRSERLSNTTGPGGTQGNTLTPISGRFGAALAVGDINGDGLKDILIAAPSMPSANFTTNNCCASGRVYVVYGAANGFAAETTASGSSISGASTVDHLGSSVAAGDINGDGYDDIIVGAATANSLPGAAPGTTDDGGAAYIVYGSATALGSIDLAKSPANVVTMRGAAAGDLMGWSVAAGDVNGDGYADAVIAAPFADPTSASSDDRGAVYLVHGAASLPAVIDLNKDVAVTVQGRAVASTLGCSVAANDVNGDGYDDLLLGSPQNGCMNNNDTQRGTLDLFYGNGPALASRFINLATASADTTVTGVANGDGTGDTAAILGDVNGDGFGDLGIGLPFAGTYGSGTGEFDLLLGGGTAASAVRMAKSHGGDARIDFGSTLRTKIQFSGGDNTSTTTATLYRGNGAIASLNADTTFKVAAAYWGITSDRSNLSSVTVTFHYLDGEVSGINPGSLTLYQTGDRSNGPWTAVTHSTVDVAHRTVSGVVATLASTPTYFALKGAVAVTPPKVVSVSPKDKQQDVDTGNVITVTFDKDMDAKTLNSATFALNNGTHGTISYDANTKTATFTPSGPLTPGFPYTVTLTTGVTDNQGNALAASYSWSFFTAGTTPLFNLSAASGGGGSLGPLEAALALIAIGLFGRRVGSARAAPGTR